MNSPVANHPENLSAASAEYNVQFWAEEANRIHWQTPFDHVVEQIAFGPRSTWFAGGKTNLCYNALDRHLPIRKAQDAIIHRDYLGQIEHITYQSLWEKVNSLSSLMLELNICEQSRVMICLPSTPMAAVAMLACARLGAMHIVVYSAMTTDNLAQRLVASEPELILHCSEKRGRISMPDIQMALAQTNIKCASIDISADNFAVAMVNNLGRVIPCAWVSAAHPSHLLFTSGTTGTPKGIVRDTGGYAVALMSSMTHLFNIEDDEIFFTTADVGWVTGHSYGIYAPLLRGITTVISESSPVNSPGNSGWQLIHAVGVTRLLTIAGAMRLARQQGKPQIPMKRLKRVYLAGEPLDNATHDWLTKNLDVSIDNHYWQTESGWPLLAGNGCELTPVLTRSVTIINPETGLACAEGEVGMLVVRATLGPGGMQTLWNDDIQHDQRYWLLYEGQWCYATQDCAVWHAGKIRLHGRIDDVINVGGKRLSTVEVENALADIDEIMEVVATRISHPVLGEMVALYVVTNCTDKTACRCLKKEIKARIKSVCGRYAVPRKIAFIRAIPKTFSGKFLRRELEK